MKNLKTRNANGEMVPLGTLVKVKDINAPVLAGHYNMYPTAEITGNTAPGVSSGEAIQLMQDLAEKVLPRGMRIEWTELSLLQILAGNTAVYIFPLCVLMMFLVLAAQYESWSLPLAIILIVPMCLLFAIFGVWLRGLDNNLFTQIGLVVLMGLACKNAILIVEFAKQLQDAGRNRTDAAIEASRLRLRPILMTSLRVHLWRDPAHAFPRRWRRNAGFHWHRRLLRHVGRHLLRRRAHAGVLRRHPPGAGAQESGGESARCLRRRLRAPH